MQSKLLYHFIGTTKLAFKCLEECGVKNVMMPFNHVSRLDVEKVAKFSHVMVNSGSKHGTKMEDYFEWIEKNKEVADEHLQYDSNLATENAEYFRRHKMRGHLGMVPILTGNWLHNMSLIKEDYAGKFYALSKDNERLRSLPRNCTYHGIGREITQSGGFLSMDGASWTFTAAVRTTNIWMGRTKRRVGVGNRIRGHGTIARAFPIIKKDMEECGLSRDVWTTDKTEELYKIPIAAFYRPYLRSIGAFDDNFVH